ncbi:MAG: lamin tail domain-containing protein [Streptosporangiaceae bacterium]
MNPIIMAAGLVAVGLLSPGMAVTSAKATPSVHISRVWYDSPGRDSRSTTSLNGEWVQIKNSGAARRSLKGWTLRDRGGNVYVFPAFTLGAGKTVKIHTGSGKNGASHRYQRRKTSVWNNSGDAAILRNAAGTSVDSCSWTQGVSKYC